MKIRRASEHDTAEIVRMLREMVEALEAHGHHAMSHAPETWAAVDARVSESLQASDHLSARAADRRLAPTAGAASPPAHLFLVAEDAPGASLVGLLEVRVEKPAPVFAPKRILHVSAVYVAPEYRRRGLARELLRRGLEWGREQSCVEAQLHALVQNSAKALYESLGFRPVEVRMALPIAPG